MDLTPEQIAEAREAIKHLRVELVRTPTEGIEEYRRDVRARYRFAFLEGLGLRLSRIGGKR